MRPPRSSAREHGGVAAVVRLVGEAGFGLVPQGGKHEILRLGRRPIDPVGSSS